MGQIRHYNNGKWTIFTTGEELSTKSGVTNTYYIGPNLSDGIYTKVDPDGTKIDLESSSGGAQPKIYKALLTQSGTNAPVSTVLVNTLSGTPVWSRVSIGYYKLTLSSEFTNNKTYYPPFGEMGNILSDGSSGITLYDDTGGILGFYHFYKLSSSEFVLKSYDGSFNAVDISSIIGTGYICLPPIEVYP